MVYSAMCVRRNLGETIPLLIRNELVSKISGLFLVKVYFLTYISAFFFFL